MSAAPSNLEVPAPTVHLEFLDSGAIALLTLDDPARANAMSAEMGDVFRERVETLKTVPGLKCVVLTAQG